MSITVILAVLGGIATFAAAVKGVPEIYRAIKNVGKFFGALEDIGEIEKIEQNQYAIQKSLTEVNETLQLFQAHTTELKDIKNLVSEFTTTISKISDDTVELTIAGFKSNANYSKVPSFIIATENKNEHGKFIWANDLWYDLYGIGFTEAKNGQHWDCIIEEDRERVMSATTAAAKAKIDFRVTYSVRNQKSGEIKKVVSNSWPLVPYNSSGPDAEIVYLGGIDFY